MPLKPVFVFFSALALFGVAACDYSMGPTDAVVAESPDPAATDNLPPSPNNAGTGHSNYTTSFAAFAGQLPDSSNPTPS